MHLSCRHLGIEEPESHEERPNRRGKDTELDENPGDLERQCIPFKGCDADPEPREERQAHYRSQTRARSAERDHDGGSVDRSTREEHRARRSWDRRLERGRGHRREDRCPRDKHRIRWKRDRERRWDDNSADRRPRKERRACRGRHRRRRRTRSVSRSSSGISSTLSMSSS